MPTVPSYGELRTSISAGGNTPFQGPSGPAPGDMAGKQAQAAGEAAQGLGGRLGQIAADMAQQANETRVTDAISQLTSTRLKLTYDPTVGYVHKRGEAALPNDDGTLDQKYGEDFKKSIDSISDSLGNDFQKRKFSEVAAAQMAQFQTGITSHVAKEFQDHSMAVQDTAVKTWQDQMGLAWGDANALAQARDGIYTEAVKRAKLSGLSGAETEAYAHNELSAGHASAIMAMLQAQQPELARTYLAQSVKAGEITAKDKLVLTQHLDVVGAAVEGEKGADTTWQKFAPQGPNDSVRIYDMEAAARETYKSRPEVLKATIDGLRQRAAAFNAQQTEVNAKNTNSVYDMIDGGTPMNKVKSSAAWLNLSGQERDKVMAQQETRAAARASRAASEESRALTGLIRQDKLMLLTHADQYLDASTADNLASKTIDQVKAMRSTFGFEATQELVKKWETVQNRDGKLTAKLDDQTFKSVAREVLDIDPYATGLTADQKAELGRVRTRVDIGLGQLAASKRAPLTLEEKTDFMRQEVAKTVEVKGMLWGTNTRPAAALSADEAAKVVVPETKRGEYAQEMQKAYQASGGNPRYAPTEENLRRYHLQKTSPIAATPNATTK